MKRLRPYLPPAAVLWGALTLTSACDSQPSPPPNLGKLGSFSYQDQSGETVGSADLQGKPMVLNFIFTRCPDRCPLFTSRFANLQRKLGDRDVHYVSITVDPEYDSPEVLAQYAQKYGADPDRWRFLTGDLSKVQRPVLDAFLQYLEGRDIQGEPDLMEIVHGEMFLLVDGQGQVRGFFGSDDHSFEQLQKRLDQLAKG